MSSLLTGYNYDIFISYRQKDNRHDGWVTEFVDHLKAELESTFKEEISVYSDINPQDGLLETHDVDASLKEKLKCLVFIPIISRTYCDPKSFAWEFEFKSFIKQASEDRFGLKVNLADGNVSSRVLPVIIHDLDADDRSLCESILGGALRGIEFIYKEPGVNRQLIPEDDPKVNLNKTKYRNQLNKVALAVKEIMTAISRYGEHKEGKLPTSSGKQVHESIEQTEKSIAVLPFINDSPDEENAFFINGIMEEVLNNLQRIKDLRVISRTSVEQYRDRTKSITEIAEELGVNYIVEGSGQKYGNVFRLRTQLIQAGKESHLWGESFQQRINEVEDIFNIQSCIAEEIARELKAVITPREKMLIEKLPTKELAAYEDYLKGQFYWRKLTAQDFEISLKYFEMARDKDPGFALAYAGICDVWIGRQQLGITPPDVAGPLAYEAAMKALELDSNRAEVHYTLALMYTWGMFDWEAGENSFKKAIELKPAYPEAHIYYAHLLNILSRPEEAHLHDEIAIRLDPANPLVIALYGVDHIFYHEFEKALKIAHEALQMDATSGLAAFVIAFANLRLGRYQEMTDGFLKQFSIQYPGIIKAINLTELGEDYRKTLEMLATTSLNLRDRIYVLPSDIAQIFEALGDKDQLFELLEKGIEEHDPSVPYFRAITEKFTDDPRFRAIAAKLNLPYK